MTDKYGEKFKVLHDHLLLIDIDCEKVCPFLSLTFH